MRSFGHEIGRVAVIGISLLSLVFRAINPLLYCENLVYYAA